MDTSKPIKTINWSLFAALLVFLFILLLLSRCHPNVGVAVPPGASSTAPAALPQGGPICGKRSGRAACANMM